MSDLFDSYKEEVRLNLKHKVPFGEHQRKAFQTIVDAEIERLKATIKELEENIRVAGEFVEEM